jgi:hypothetical protein
VSYIPGRSLSSSRRDTGSSPGCRRPLDQPAIVGTTRHRCKAADNWHLLEKTYDRIAERLEIVTSAVYDATQTRFATLLS